MSKQITELPHLDLIESNGINTALLPMLIRNKLKMLSASVGRYKNKPSKPLLDNINIESVRICELIQNHLEEDLPEPIAIAEPKEPTPASEPIADSTTPFEQEMIDYFGTSSTTTGNHLKELGIRQLKYSKIEFVKRSMFNDIYDIIIR